MSTGDIKNNLRKLQNELKLIQYMKEIDYEKMLIGLSAPYLPILHFVFTEYSCELSSYFSSKGYDLFAKSDFRFLEIIYKILIQEFETKPMLTKNQFFAIGYSEMKMIFVTKIVNICRQKYNSIMKKAVPKKKKIIKRTNQNRNILSDDEEVKYPNSVSDVYPSSVDIDFNIDTNKNEDNSEPTISGDDSSTVRIDAPKPTPLLALSPVQTYDNKIFIDDNDDKDLDLSDIGEESFVETVGVELVDVSSDEESPKLPEFSITKHSDRTVSVKVNENNSLPKALLPSNIDLVSPDKPSQTVKEQQCLLCSANATQIKKLCQQMEEMEDKITKLTKENEGLTSKVFLLDNKIKLFESAGCSEKEKMSNNNTSKDVSEISNDFKNSKKQTTNPSNVGKSYSPIKYTDDNIIIKDFKPISMKDVHNMMNEESRINKENQQAASQMKTFMARKEPFSVKVFSDDSSSKMSSLTLSDELDDLSSDSYDVSKLDDDFTEQAIANVKRRLRETEKMLKSCENYM